MKYQHNNSNEEMPFEEGNFDGYSIRKFSKNLDESELKWHYDNEDRIVEALNENDWKFQMDNELPKNLHGVLEIPKEKYHRVIKGTTDLYVKITKK